MTEYCKLCGTAVEELTAAKVGELLKRFKSMWIWEEYAVGHTADVPGLGEVEVVSNSYLTNSDDNGAIKLVWKTRAGYVGISGYYSSYSGSEWNGEFLPAEKKTQEVVYFE